MVSWLKAAGVSASNIDASPRDAVYFRASIALVCRLFDIEFAFFRHAASGRVLLKHLPRERDPPHLSSTPVLSNGFDVEHVILYAEGTFFLSLTNRKIVGLTLCVSVSGVTSFPFHEDSLSISPKPAVAVGVGIGVMAGAVDPANDDSVTPDWLRARYNFPIMLQVRFVMHVLFYIISSGRGILISACCFAVLASHAPQRYPIGWRIQPSRL